MSACGCTVPADPLVEAFLSRVRRLGDLEGPLTITSWRRTPAENAAEGGIPNSLHLVGLAMDLAGGIPGDVVRTARRLGLDAVDEGDHVHVELDVRRRGIQV